MGQNFTSGRENVAANRETDGGCWAWIRSSKSRTRFGGNFKVLLLLMALLSTAGANATGSCYTCTPPTIKTQASNKTLECNSGCTNEFNAWLNNHGGAVATCTCGKPIVWSHNCAGLSNGCGNTGEATVTFTAKGDCGKTATTKATFKIVDTKAPVITKQASNSSMACGASCNTSFQSWLNNRGGATATDDCGSVSWSHNCSVSAPNCGSVTVVFTAKDECGNKSTTQATFSVTDSSPPTITKQASNSSAACGSSCNTNFTTWLNNRGGATASDNCGGVTWSHDCNVSAPNGCGSVTVTFTAKDDCGNKATTKATFSVTDGVAPVITKQASNSSAACGSSCNNNFQTWLNNRGGATASDNCGSVTWSHDCTVSAPNGCGSVSVTFTAKDNCGNKATTKATFSVTDGVAPTITKQASNSSAACGSSCNNNFQSWLNNRGGATASDNCGSVTWSHDCTVSAPNGCGQVCVTFTAKDNCGNKATTRACFTVTDNVAPVITKGASDKSVNCGSSCNNDFNTWLNTRGGATASDNCGGVSWSHNCSVSAPNGCGSVTVVFTAKDECGNKATTSGTFKVVDNTPPVIAGGSNKNVNCGSTCNNDLQAWLNNRAGATATDNCGSVSWSHNCNVQAPTTCGCITVVFTAKDQCGNKSTISRDFCVVDNTPPTITKNPKNDSIECGQSAEAALNAWLANNGGFTASDNCGSVTYSKETTRVNGCGNTFSVVATFTATDQCSNKKTASATFKVVDHTAPVAICKSITVELVNGEATITAADVNNGSYDACGTVTLAIDSTNFTCANTGENNVKLTVTDQCGNTSSCNAVVTITGGGGPVSCPPPARDLLLVCGAGELGYPVLSPARCPVTRTPLQSKFTCADIGTKDVIVLVVSGSTTQQCTVTVTVRDSVYIGQPGADLTVNCPASDLGNLFTAPAEECGELHTFATRAEGNCANEYSITRGWYITDSCGTVSDTVYQTINVVDNTPPTIGEPGASTTIYCIAAPKFTAPTASDACGIANIDSFDVRNGEGCSFSVTRNWYATDACGNISDTVSQTITVIDEIAPTIGGQGADATISCPATPVFTAPTASDLCSEVTIDSFSSRTELNCGYSVTRSWYAVDACGNVSDTVSQTITVTDNTKPTIGGQGQNGTVACGGTPVFTAPTAEDACSTAEVITITPDVTSGTGCNQTVTRSWYAIDACGNISDTVSQVISTSDNIKPTLSGQGGTLSIYCIASPLFTAPKATDNCDPNPVISSIDTFAAGPCPGTFNQVRIWWATDACGNVSDSVTQTVKVRDYNKPSVKTLPGANATISCPSTPVFTGPKFHDNCSTPVIDSFDTRTELNCGYSIKRSWYAMDACGNKSDTVSQTITVTDNTPPVAICKNISITLVDGHAVITAADVNNGSYDVCSEVRLSATPLDFTCANLGANTVTLTVSDLCGNTATCSATVTVEGVGPEVSVNDTTICLGEDATLTATSAGDSPSYSWNTGATTQSITVAPVTTTTYYVTVTTGGGCTATDSGTVTVRSVTITAGPDTTICLGACVQLTASGADFYTWTPKTGLNDSTIQNPLACPTETTTYTVTGFVPNLGGNMVVNGDFGGGNTGFTSDYGYVAPGSGPNSLVPEGLYAVDKNPNDYHPRFYGQDHTNGRGNFMIVNGAPDAGVTVWEQTINGLTPNSTYFFSTWIAALNNINVRAKLSFSINGVPLGSPILAPADSFNWKQFYTTWNSGAATSAHIAIVNEELIRGGNDFGLDDIMFTTGDCPATAEVTVTVTRPEVFCKNDTLIVQSGEIACIDPMDVIDSVYAPCGVDSMWTDPSCFECSNVGEHVVTVYIKDIYGIVASCEANVLVRPLPFTIVRCPVSRTLALECGVATLTPPTQLPGDTCVKFRTVLGQTEFTCDDLGVNEVSITVYDPVTGDSTVCSWTIEVTDTARIGTPGAPLTVSCPAADINNLFTAPSYNEECDELETYTITTPGQCGGSYIRTRYWYVVDACGIISDTVSQSITVIDNTDPTISGQGEDFTIYCIAAPKFTAPTATDECSAVTIDSFDVRTSGRCEGAYTLTRNWYATDACGNVSDTVSQTITVVDEIAPTIGGQGASATIYCPATPVFTTPTASDLCSEVTIDSFSTRAELNCGYSVTRNWYATDACGNVSDTVSQTITVTDITKPTISAPGANIVASCTENPQYTSPTASDLCGTVRIDSSEISGVVADCPYATFKTRFWWAIDACGNSSDTVKQSISLVDNNKPVVSNPGENLTVTCGEEVAGVTSCESFDSYIVPKSPIDSTTHAFYYYRNGNGFLKNWEVTNGTPQINRTGDFTTTAYDGTQFAAWGVDNKVIGEGAALKHAFEAGKQYTITLARKNNSANAKLDVDYVLLENSLGFTYTFASGATAIPAVPAGALIVKKDSNLTKTDWQVVTITTPVLTKNYSQFWIRPYWTKTTQGQAIFLLDAVCITDPKPAQFGTPTASDSCDPNPTLASFDVRTPGQCAQSYTDTRGWYATDACGNVSDTVYQSITVIDNNKPTVSTLTNKTISCTATPQFDTPTAFDRCDPQPSLQSFDSRIAGNCPQSYTLVRGWYATDACGNVSDTVYQSIAVVDNNKPTVSALSNKFISCTATPQFDTPTATDSCDPQPVLSSNEPVRTNGNCPQSYTLTKTWYATDACGNRSADVTQTITITDNNKPKLSGQGTNKMIACTETPAFTSPVAFDSCDASPRIDSITTRVNGSCASSYSVCRKWWATDACGNVSDTVKQTIKVVDNVGPVVSGQGPNKEISCTASPVFTSPTASDVCDQNPKMDSTTSSPVYTCPQSYYIIRSWWAKDACGNMSNTVSQKITVTDKNKPVVSTLPNSTISCTAQPVFGTPTASDSCDTNPTLFSFNNRVAGNCPQSYILIRGWYAVDHCGNVSDTIYQSINVVDNNKPVVTELSDIHMYCYASPLFGTPTASDSCDPNPVLYSNEPVRTEGNCPQAYSVTKKWWAIDACGNVSDTVSQTIFVTDTTRPYVSTLPNSTILCTEQPVFGTPTAGDLCDPNPTLYSFDGRIAGNCPQSYTLTKGWYAVDHCGNVSDTIYQSISVVDNNRPAVSSLSNLAIACDETPVFGTPVATDTCDPNPSLYSSEPVRTNGSCAYSYTLTKKWWAVDACGNKSDTVSQTITVTDTQAPVVIKKGQDGSISCELYLNGACFSGIKVTDNCDPSPKWDSTTIIIPGTCPSSYTAIRKWWAVDACGNKSDTVTQTINVYDNSKPVLSGQGANATLSCSSIPTFKSPVVRDNCDLNAKIYKTDIYVDGACEQAYTLIRKWWAVDACGNISDTVSQTINITDNNAPVLSGQGQNIEVSCTSCQSCTPNFTNPTVYDECDLNPTISYTDTTTTGNCNSYSIKRTWTAVDACGNVSLPVSQTISVGDHIAPVITCAGDDVVECGVEVVFGTPTVSDNCDKNPLLSIVTSDSTVANPNGSVSHIRIFSAIDACGNSSTCSQVITALPCDARTANKSAIVSTGGTSNEGSAIAKFVAYPNPAQTTVTFSMLFNTDETNVTLVMMTIDGRIIATLYQGAIIKGSEYKVPFDVTTIPSGNYLYRLTTNDNSVVEKLTIIK